MGRIKLNYREGSCFLVPLQKEGYARGVVARMDGRGCIFGYFFGPKLLSQDCRDACEGLTSSPSVLLAQFGDLGLINGEWKICGEIVPWNRSEWPMPPFLHLDAVSNEPFLRYYSEDTLKFTKDERVQLPLRDSYPQDGLSGYVAIEIKLTMILDE